MIFGKRRQKCKHHEITPYANFVLKKVTPSLISQRNIILETAQKSFPQGIYERGAEIALTKFGHATAQTIALALAGVARNSTGKELTDIEYGDCALAAHFLMRLPFRNCDEAIDFLIGDWLSELETDLRYLVFAESDASLIDLIENGNDRYLYYENHKDAKLPNAYFCLLAQVLRQRETGEWEPYRLLDAMRLPDPILVASFDDAWGDIGDMVQHWMDTVLEVQKEADKNGLEIWEWW